MTETGASTNQTGKPSPFSLKTYHQTLHWVTKAAIQGLTPYSGRDPSEFPEQLALDELLQADSENPDVWVNPKQEDIGPLRPKVEGQPNIGWLSRKNGFFRALRAWRPTHEIGELNLGTKFRLEYILDDENGKQYLRTVLHLGDGDNYHTPSALLRRPRNNENRESGGRGAGGRNGGRGPSGPYRGQAPRRDNGTSNSAVDPTVAADPNSWANRVRRNMEDTAKTETSPQVATN